MSQHFFGDATGVASNAGSVELHGADEGCGPGRAVDPGELGAPSETTARRVSTTPQTLTSLLECEVRRH